MSQHSADHESYVTTGLPTLDAALGGGLLPGGFYVLAGRGISGKSLLAQKLVLAAARQGWQVVAAYLEGSTKSFAERLVSIMTGLPVRSVMEVGRLPEDDRHAVEAAVQELRTLSLAWFEGPSFVDGRPVDWADWLQRLRVSVQIQRGRGPQVGLVLIDYLQLVPRDDSVSPSSRAVHDMVGGGLADLATNLQVPVLLVSQLDRPAEDTSPTPPTLTDLDAIAPVLAQRATGILLVHRDDVDISGQDDAGQIDIIVAKAPPLGTSTVAPLMWVGHIGTATDPELLPPLLRERLATPAIHVADVLAEVLQGMPDHIRRRVQDPPQPQ